MPVPGVQRFVQPDYSDLAQDGSTYPVYLDRAVSVVKRTAAAFAPHQVYSGSPNPDLAVEIDAGSIWDGANLTEVAAQTVTGFTIPSAGQNRVDRIVLDAVTGAASRVAGTAVTGSPTAVAPAIPAGTLPCAQVTITSSDTAVLNSMITDERALCTSPSIPPGAMMEYAGNGSGSPGSPPTGWLFCDGSNVSRTTYAALFAAIGTTWGAGNGSTTFTLPDTRRRTAVGAGGSGTATLGASVGSTGGSETHTLVTGELAAHNHSVTDPGHIHYDGRSDLQVSSGAGGGYAVSSNMAGSISQVSSATTGVTTQNNGSGTAHNNMQPSYVVNKLIKV